MNYLLRTFSLIALFHFVGALKAESPSDFHWSARWIGPGSGNTPDLAGANWIWADEPGADPVKNAAVGTREFTKNVVLPPGRRIARATAVFTADDRFELLVNGKPVGSGDAWQRPARIDITSALRPGANALLVKAVNGPSSGSVNAAGLIGKIRIEPAGAPPLEIATDSSWVSQGRPARVIGPLGTAPWGNLREDAGPASNLWTAYRKTFDLAHKPATAPARIAVDSKYWLWVNGTLVVREGGLKRGPNRTDTYFDVVDLAPYLVQGRNQIAVLTWFFGRDGFSHKNSGTPGFLFELTAPTGPVVSDASWKTLRHPSFGEASKKSNFRLAESSVRFDARLEPQGWTAAAFDDSAWGTAAERGAPPAAPWNKLWERPIPQWKDFGLKDYVNSAELAGGNGGTLTARLPYNAQVTPWIKVSAPAGRLIRMKSDNDLCDIQAEYLTREGVQEFETPAWMSGHAVIYEIPKDVRVLGLKYRESGFNTEFTGTFTCDDVFLNTLWGKCRRTLYINMRDTFFDCPDRERAAWWGDIVIQLGQVFHTFDPRAHSLIRKCMYNLANWQNPSKTFFSPIPAGNWNKELPQQMLASIGQYGFWNYYLHTGDKQTLADLYPHVRDYLSIWQTDADGLIVHRSGENGWDWADWGKEVDLRVLDQAWFCLALDGAARMADELGKPAEASAYRAKRGSVIAAVNARCWNGQAYRDPQYKGATDDRAQGMAVVAGIAGPDKFPAIRAELARSFHASPYLEKYILESLFLMDAPDAAIERLRTRYKEMVGSETSTLWELFSRADGTINHAWTGGPLTLLYEEVAGVAPTSPGYATYRVTPRLGPLKRVEAGFDSVKGRIEVKIANSPDGYYLRLSSPAGTKATVSLPVHDPARAVVKANGVIVWRNGSPAQSIARLAPGRIEGGRLNFVASPGDWTFEAR
ncbi:MAG: alpha-L-rhamnosidase C-terminal domain-containing protein [Verrucomicrobiota bacterium]